MAAQSARKSTHTSGDLLTIAVLADHFGLPESTARFYCKRFLPYLPHTGRGKKRRYLPETMDIMSFIVSRMKKHKNAGAVEAELDAKYPKTEPEESDSKQSGSCLILQDTESYRDIASGIARLSEKVLEIADLKDRLQKMEERIEEVCRGLDHIRVLQNEAEKIHQQDLEQLRKWINRIAHQKP